MNKIVTHSSQNYAEALFETGHNYEADLNLVQNVVDTSADFNNIISNPAIDLNIKYSILDEVFKNKIDEKVLQFIKILTEKNRLKEFSEIRAAYLEKVLNFNNIKIVEITSAIELNDETKTRILTKLREKLNKEIIPQWGINPEIISGLVFKIGDDIVDTSLQTKIESIGKNIR